jgi:Domain of unknown function (DUF4760)
VADWGSVPQWITAAVAGGALVAAIISIRSQREIARKREATDFFLKTEMDRETLESHKRYTQALNKLAMVVKNDGDIASHFVNSDEYWAIRDYLNLHELVSVGILNNVFDDKVCHDFWAGEMHRAFEKTMPLIKCVQNPKGSGRHVQRNCSRSPRIGQRSAERAYTKAGFVCRSAIDPWQPGLPLGISFGSVAIPAFRREYRVVSIPSFCASLTAFSTTSKPCRRRGSRRPSPDQTPLSRAWIG